MNIFYAASNNGGCGYHRIVVPAKYMSMNGHIVDYALGAIDINQISRGCQLFIMQMQCDPIVLKNLKLLQSRGIKVAYEIDDDIWNVPVGNPNYKYWDEKRVGVAEEIMKNCDAIITTNDLLASRMTGINENVYVIPNFIEDFYKNVFPIRSNKLRIGWAGGDSHLIDFTPDIVKALLDVKKEYDTELLIVGNMPPSLAGHARCVFPSAFPPAQYMDQLAICRFDIGIIPCAKIKLNECRSNLKYLEYSILGIPSVASNARPYVETIIQENNGIVVENKYEDWYNALKKLIESETFRRHIGNNAKAFVKKYWLIKDNIEVYEKTYRNILKQ